MISLDSYKVLKKLTIGQIHVEPKKVRASYVVENFSGETNAYEFIYSYEHAYFDRTKATDVNLASMMLAQVAINYGLFCEIIEFDGLFDEADKRFIREMTENTSREILTNKLLIKNEFLKAPYNSLKTEKRKSYTQAELVFSNTMYSHLHITKEIMAGDPGKYAILSSGGKDSLLTYGIISEIGEPYPVFINESGRHWFTAVNSYRYYKNNIPNTEKPWSNCDRLFNWMLKQLPFIKENYASIRADIYPVRLWTVAVFLFGVLPVVKKKGIGNILIGNEYDTTLKGNHEGITHYNGLYDQSKYFDNALTRYYSQKGWRIVQYSLLRSLSELLIMKILLNRYPELQMHQVSCHAAHEVDGRMFPCGKCEKCRRIIGMIKALESDPENCGYNSDQVSKGLKSYASHSVKQIGSDAAHLFYMLFSNGLIDKNEFTGKAAKRHPEIMKLRFDQERSNLEDLPQYIRKPLFAILSQYADGMVIRKDKRWVDFTMDDDFLNSTNYKFDEK